MWIHESPERLLVQEGQSWRWCAGGVMVVVGLILLAAAAGIFRAVHWDKPLYRSTVGVLGAVAVLGGVVPLLGSRDWILEMDRTERTVVLRRRGLWGSQKGAWPFESFLGARVVETEGDAFRFQLEILVDSGGSPLAVHSFVSDKASCERARSSIERVLGEPQPLEPRAGIRARMRM